MTVRHNVVIAINWTLSAIHHALAAYGKRKITKSLKKKWKTNMLRNSKKAADKIAKVMGEFKDKGLHSGKGGKIVTNPKQAIAIALSESGMSKKKSKKK